MSLERQRWSIAAVMARAAGVTRRRRHGAAVARDGHRDSRGEPGGLIRHGKPAGYLPATPRRGRTPHTGTEQGRTRRTPARRLEPARPSRHARKTTPRPRPPSVTPGQPISLAPSDQQHRNIHARRLDNLPLTMVSAETSGATGTAPPTLNAAAHCAPVSSISAGQQWNGRVADTGDIVYGSAGRRMAS